MAKNTFKGGYTHRDSQTRIECRQGKKGGKIRVQELLSVAGIQWKNNT